MKSKILTLLFMLGCCGFAFSQAPNEVANAILAAECPPETGTPNPAPAVVDICSDGSNSMVYTVIDPTFNTTLPNAALIVEVTINGVSSLVIIEPPTSFDPDPTLYGAMPGDQISVVGATYDLAQINTLISTLANGFVCSFAGLDAATCAAIAALDAAGGISDLQGALDFAATLGVPAPTSIAEAYQLLVDLNTQADPLGGVCYGLSTPGGAPDFTYNVIECAACPVIQSVSAVPADGCNAEMVDVVVTYDQDPTGLVTADINGAVGVIAGMTITYSLTLANATCDPMMLDVVHTATCDDDGSNILDAAGVDTNGSLGMINVYPLLEETITASDCAGVAGSAILAVAGVGGIECENIPGVAGVANVCPDLVDIDADLVYDFTGFTTPCFTGTMQMSAPIDCAVVCPVCPNYVDTTVSAAEVCDGETVTVCINFDAAADDVTVNGNGPALAGDTQICYDVIASNTDCNPASETSTPTVVCTLDGLTITATDATWITNPILMETIVQPDCAGTAGSATLESMGGGVPCASETIGVAGTVNVCPSTADTDADLAYDFTGFTNPCFTGTMQVSAPIDCAITCAACPNVAGVTASPMDVCAGATVTICVDFDAAADDVTVNGNGPALAGDTQICYDVTAANLGCIPAGETSTPTVVCTLDGLAIPATDAAWTTNPVLVETIVQPDCAGTAGSATLETMGGAPCASETIGVAGAANVCPATADTDADLAYDFTGFTNPCFTGTMQVSAPIDCAVICPPTTIFGGSSGFGIADPCACNGDEVYNEGMPTDVGTFSETIYIGTPAGDPVADQSATYDFTVTAIAANSAASGTTAPTATVGAVLLWDDAANGTLNDNLGYYTISFNHTSNSGYETTIEVTLDAGGNLEATLNIGNQCAYPTFSLLSSSVTDNVCVDGSEPDTDDPDEVLVLMVEEENAGEISVGVVNTYAADPEAGAGTASYVSVTTEDDGNNGIAPNSGANGPAYPSTVGCAVSIDLPYTVSTDDTCLDVANIPTVGQWGLIILGLLMSITAVVGIRQRREEEAYS